jgi:hypothetical protein
MLWLSLNCCAHLAIASGLVSTGTSHLGSEGVPIDLFSCCAVAVSEILVNSIRYLRCITLLKACDIDVTAASHCTETAD